MALIELSTAMQKAGIIGAGGAGFPSYAKLSDKADTLVINCAECEPLIYTDFSILREEMHKVCAGATLLMENTNISRTVIPIKAHRAELLGFSDNQEIAPNIFIKFLPHIYPIGDEINLIYQSTGILIEPGNLPISKGIIVYNGETVLNIYNAIMCHESVLCKWVTIGGDIPQKFVVKVPVGMRVREIFDKLAVKFPEDHVLIDGGPAMGNIKNINTAVITKTTKSLLILPQDIGSVRPKQATVNDMLRRAASCCCGCSRCTDMCPRNLLGYPIEPHKMIRVAMSEVPTSNPLLISTATLCCGCGICEQVCCQDISPRAVIATLKAMLAEKRIKYVAPQDSSAQVNPDRDYHLISSEKWQDMMGVTAFDNMVPKMIDDELVTKKVEITLNSHIGAPSRPCVQIGDKVEKGQMIAFAGDGLSVPAHASIAGTITAIGETTIVIES